MHVNTTPHCSFRLISICLQLLILRCPLQWESVESSCFYFSRASLNWHDARDWCHAHQSQLLILTDDKDWDYMRSHVGHTFYWVGLTDEGGKWEWVNGTPYTIDRRRWKPGQPDNWAGHGFGSGTEDCAHIHLDGRLNDLHCSERLRFICPQELLQTSKR
uniref:C-type lectin domain-containing protein n=1 Tax=Neogobius melanostomus TaxID=47308 RepID=A0A8C6T784_9GOBI